ncbi:hypothetical protein JR590_002191 [Listeria monocytogenes]|uniref:hypothetical protein n=1 Tax=Listeria TaxID=1637 RepID=UPI0011EB8A5B|nr:MULTISPECIES: hypothetical protein [Listeria]EBF5115585.1 hypothetical protein [Listeria monocytogenes]EBF5125245.1 hypothetical protein [Listeria monocytogenes]EBF5150739.1 hypothetical protein [Listeria monocytogenes]EBF5202806.1 hypothetical protein [Listeria monocytogenes]EHD1588426.1 hypothetical protein [Listeria monocytogenes]
MGEVFKKAAVAIANNSGPIAIASLIIIVLACGFALMVGGRHGREWTKMTAICGGAGFVIIMGAVKIAEWYAGTVQP